MSAVLKCFLVSEELDVTHQSINQSCFRRQTICFSESRNSMKSHDIKNNIFFTVFCQNLYDSLYVKLFSEWSYNKLKQLSVPRPNSNLIDFSAYMMKGIPETHFWYLHFYLWKEHCIMECITFKLEDSKYVSKALNIIFKLRYSTFMVPVWGGGVGGRSLLLSPTPLLLSPTPLLLSPTGKINLPMKKS